MRKIIRITLAAVVSSVAVFVLAEQAKAETIVNSTAELLKNKTAMQYVFSRQAMLVMYQLGVEDDKKFNLQTDCKSKYQVKPVGAVVLKPITFPDGGQNPTKGIWLTRYQLDRCGDSKIYNTLFLADAKGGNPTPKAFYPGNPLAGPMLVQDAVMLAVTTAIARSGLKECTKADVFDMRVTQPPHDVVEGGKTLRGVWNELWTFKACGQMLDVAMTFTPDADGGGTSFSTGPVTSKRAGSQ